jgi:hypothetical protein
LSALTKQAVVAQRYTVLRAATVNVPARSFAGEPLKDKEKGDERIFFTKNDGKSKNSS